MKHERLNAECLCLPTGADIPLAAPHSVFLPVRTKTALLQATEAVGRQLTRLRSRVAAVDNAGIFNSFDYHITPDGPKLIEINVNAGGAFLQPALSASTAPLPAECHDRLVPPAPFDPVETLLSSWAWHAADRPLQRVAIVDEAPSAQALFCDMQAAARALAGRGVECDILDIGELAFRDGRLMGPSGPIDMVYNRWTDFSWSSALAEPLRQAHQTGAALIAPNPDTWRAYADKSLLIELARLPSPHPAILPAEPVSAQSADKLWDRRKQLVFKPLQGFGSRGVYRGDKMSRRKWAQICEGRYLAQGLAPPGLRTLPTGTGDRRFKFDIRVWTHGIVPIYMAARLFSGQVTGMSGPSEGFAPIFWTREDRHAPHACGH